MASTTTDFTLQSEYSYLLWWMDDVDAYDYDNTCTAHTVAHTSHTHTTTLTKLYHELPFS